MVCISLTVLPINNHFLMLKPFPFRVRLRDLRIASLFLASGWCLVNANAADSCNGTVYLTIDTGSMSQVKTIADTLNQYQVKATFFMANEKTVNGDYSLDPSWADYWKARVAEGHAFGTHTFDHVYIRRDAANGHVIVKPQFGEQAGKELDWSAAQYCSELKRVDSRFKQLTGHNIGPIWRAPGGKLSPNLLAAGQACGFAHVGWAPAGFLGDELPSDSYPNDMLVNKAISNIKAGDILMMHLGIWSRKDPFAPHLGELIAGLKQRGLCFDTLKHHPDYQAAFAKAS